MSNIIDFLERMGADASLRSASAEELGRAVAAACLDSVASQAIAAGDADALRTHLAPAIFFGIQLKTDEDEEPQETGEEAPERDAGEDAAKTASLATPASA